MNIVSTHRDVHVLIPETYAHARLLGDGDLRLQVELRLLIS